ncbi:MAG: phosphatidylserine decarboxylase family protein [Magnetospirillum gryphiswaldense]|nr:phosphatidylserine decarboxylase family protein [Magnetospirillum gryphiswaldense]
MDMDGKNIAKLRHGGWLPRDENILAAFRAEIEAEVAAHPGRPLVRPVQALYDTIMDTPLYRMHLTQAIEQAVASGHRLGYADIDGLMHRINAVMRFAPPYSTSELVGCPLNALLDWPMCMPSGFAFFQFPEINARLRDVLNCWSDFLSGPDSRHYLTTQNPKGWFSANAAQNVDMTLFVCDPGLPHYGYKSWNDFFTRLFKPGMRPVAEPDNPRLVTSACESTPFALQRDVKSQDRFWIKAQPYSLLDMFGADRRDLAQHFVGGTVYQAFLSAYNYHRWHAPVDGTVVDAYLVPGTYYADAPSEGLDPAGPNNSQGFITSVAARAVMVVDTGDKILGKVAMIFVGMAEISSCVFSVKVGDQLKKGDEIGYFQYGGSTHCLIFDASVALDFIPPQPYGEEDNQIVQLNSPLARVAAR